jgi:hypothetical protein
MIRDDRVPPRIGVKQQRDHHGRVIGWPRSAVDPVGGVERGQIHLVNGGDDKPRQVILRQPLADIGRHQKRLLAITHDEALSHPRIVLNPPDGTRLMRQPQAIAIAGNALDEIVRRWEQATCLRHE